MGKLTLLDCALILVSIIMAAGWAGARVEAKQWKKNFIDLFNKMAGMSTPEKSKYFYEK